MSLLIAGPGQLAAVLKTASHGDVIRVHGAHGDPAVGIHVDKMVTLDLAPDAVIVGRWTDDRALGRSTPASFQVLGPETGDRSQWPLLDGRNSQGLPSWTLGSKAGRIRNVRATNGDTAIGFDLIDNDWGIAEGWLFERMETFEFGKRDADGLNHAHGVYDSGVANIVQDCLIRDGAARAVQFRGARGGVARRILADKNGCGVMFGDLNATGCTVEDSILARPQRPDRYLVESYQTGTGHKVTNCVAYGPRIVDPGLDKTKVAITGLVSALALPFDPVTYRILPAYAGYGPTWLQPGAAPAPAPAPESPALTFARSALVQLRMTSYYKDWQAKLAAGTVTRASWVGTRLYACEQAILKTIAELTA